MHARFPASLLIKFIQKLHSAGTYLKTKQIFFEFIQKMFANPYNCILIPRLENKFDWYLLWNWKKQIGIEICMHSKGFWMCSLFPLNLCQRFSVVQTEKLLSDIEEK